MTLPVDSIRPDIRRHLTAEDGSTVLVYRMLGFVLGEKRERDVPTDCDLMNAEIAEDEERPATGPNT